MSRTTRTSRALAVVGAVAASALALSGCSGSASGGDDGASAEKDRLTIALDADMAPNGYDPLRYSSGQRMFFEGVYDSLFELDENGAIVPSAVKEFEYSEDQTRLTLHLDTSIAFDDGTALSAELVKENLDFRGTAGLNAYSPFAAGEESEISDVTVVDDDTVELTFPKPSAGFESNLVMPAGAIVGPTGIADRASLDTAPDGSGALTLDAKATVKGNSYVLVKKEDHAGVEEYAFDSYEFRPITDPQSRVNAAISGEVDLAFIATDTQQQVESAGTGLVTNGGTVRNIIAFDKVGATGPQWSDPRVYKALSLAIDREEFVNGLHEGDRATANALPEASPGYVAELEEDYAYDPKAAKELLAEAGYPGGFDFSFTITPDSQRDIEALSKYWEAIGVNVTLKNATTTEEQFLSVQTNPLGGPLPLTWDNPLGNVFGVLFGFANFHKAEAPEIQAAAGALGAAGDDSDARAEALTKLNTAIVEAGWLIPLFEQLAPWAYNNSVLEEPSFAGSDPYPLLASLTPAS